jgi:hypothetical protein
MESARITVQEAAKLMGATEQFIRVGLQKGIFPWGHAVQINKKRYTYYIYRKQLLNAIEGGCMYVREDQERA